VYINSKVLATLKENDEKKWYRENMESEDLKGPILEDKDGEVGEPIFNDWYAMNYNMYKSDDETIESLNWNDDDFGVNR